MRLFEVSSGDAAQVSLDVTQIDVKMLIIYDGTIESVLEEPLGRFYGGTRLYGRVWTAGQHVVIRYYAIRPPGWESIPICAEAKSTLSTPLLKIPTSEAGTAAFHSPFGVVVAVEKFR